jgi:hypothetical protein
MKKHITIVAGHVTDGQREQRTLAWLAQHGVKVEEWNGLQVLAITGGELNKGIYIGGYVVVFDNFDGDPELSSLTISLEVDPNDTRLSVEFEGDYGCTCKGLGCAMCNEELRSIARGETPYAHHTATQEAEVCDQSVNGSQS